VNKILNPEIIYSKTTKHFTITPCHDNPLPLPHSFIQEEDTGLIRMSINLVRISPFVSSGSPQRFEICYFQC